MMFQTTASLLSLGIAIGTAVGTVVSVPSPRDLLDDPCATFRLPPRAVNATFLDQVTVEQPWVEPPFGFGYGKWALAWTSIELYWDWLNMQNEWYPLHSEVKGNLVSDIEPTVIADVNSFQMGDNDTVIITPGTDTPLPGEVYAWNYTIPADIMAETDNTAWVGWGFDFYEQGAPYFVDYDASTTGVLNVSYGISIYSRRERGPSDQTVAEIAKCYDKLGSKDFADLFRSMRRTPTDGRRTHTLSWHGPSAAKEEKRRIYGSITEQLHF
ncbi:uncharacterized protein TRIVIDRAFT_70971 [Trichoderma virens Gv29-8]|uniref:DAPG hydrolase PhiG domain-containing protein n=1 Tax=Hypocrea virens (strain Gv29-8 / FGSC 10586) TaxID=413071 RepID=G9MU64_HYPVG|nr:uncharacterized protein TRIVIDRAFT_70971 [Trichoderma virens Gv29-8]EHK22017.1 hypothetical protein TRIVIDRAFT_70971 [Trichoderma virens Gv29-8]UKZ55862.1 hypothetical protein TrVGV298_009686 [Trichoderma virens]UKZ81620.1 hypothetical protein TrVFT333_009392 [Trichoderma virens FT-333]